ncbi:uncharacterized protein L199_001384 [Kwoniella botswanensis]|uniref:uncharacterized protein n=1 Tax=Kwoniella botswanensis TaxID=1268659 RepID=UPI00315D0DDD
MYGSESTSAPRPVFEMDKEAEDRFCRFVERMPPKMDGMVRLFDRGDYFSAHGSDAIYIANEVFKTTNVLKYLGTPKPSNSTSSSSNSFAKGLPSVTISTSLTKQFLREALTIKQMRIEIYSPEEKIPGRKDNTRWTLSKSGSPGNLIQLEDLLFNDQSLSSSSVIMSLKLQVKEQSKIIGIAYIDNSERLLGVGEFVENDSFGNTESLLIQLGVKECIMQSDDKKTDHDLSKLKTLVERCGVIVTERRAADYQARNVEQDLNRLLHESCAGVALPEFDTKIAMSSAAALLIYLNLLQDKTAHGQYRLHKHDLSQYMKLDASALKALNLMPQPNETGGSKNMSLYGLLDRCKTSQGKRLLARWLKQPLVNLHEIVQRQNIVEAFVDDSNTRLSIQDKYLKVMPDFHRISKKFHRRVASLEEVVRVYQAVALLPKLINTLTGIETTNPAAKDLIEQIYLKPLQEHSSHLENYIQMVEDTIDLDELKNHNIMLRPEFDENLQQFRAQLLQIRDQLDEEHVRVGRDLGLDIEKKLHLENHQVYKYSFRVTKAEAGTLRGKKGYTELATQKSGTIFNTRHLKELSEAYFDLQGKYEKTQRHLVKEVVGIAASYTPILEILDNLIAAIDVTISFAHVSANAPIPYVKPILTEKGTGDVLLQNARHPCLEVQDDVTFIPNDHEMRKNSSEFIILTGPNMGGKSTYIRQIGVIALLAQIGCFVPADQAQLPIFDCILARVGAGDSQLKGVSTFMAEMLETATILKSATKDSLIIIDELGRGTSTYDGFGLAWAISEHIASQIRCFCLFATHFHELTTLDQSLPHVKNLHVEALVTDKTDRDGKQDRNITLLYQVKEGVCDQSFGIHVAELANFPESVVRVAKRKAEELEDFGGEDTNESLTKYTKEETDQGTSLVKDFLETWKSRTGQSENANGGDEETMGLSDDDLLAELKQTAEEFKEKFESNPWTCGVMSTF